MTNTNTLRVALIKYERGQIINDAALVDVLRPMLNWETVTREQCDAIHRDMRGARGNYVLLVDHQREAPVSSIPSALDWVDEYRSNVKVASAAENKNTKTPKAKKARPLTARQKQELEELRKELGENHG